MSSGKIINHFYTANNKVELVKGGASFFNLLKQLISNANNSIHIRVYIWDDDETGRSIAEVLIAAAKRGVCVFVVADGYASQSLHAHFTARLRSNGIHFRFFEPLLKSSHFYFGRRMHEKIVVIDGEQALVGGINFADRYNDINGIPAWLDFAVHVRGDAAIQLFNYCAADWKEELNTSMVKPQLTGEKCSVRISRNDWVKWKQQIWKTYFSLFNDSEKSITVMCSYFLPGRVLRKRLSAAAKRGVKVRIILAGPSDVMVAKYAERYLYNWMLRNNIAVYEYQPTVLHAKMMVADNHRVTIGSYNVNNVSAYASVELNVDIRNRPFATSVQEMMNGIIASDCVKVKHDTFVSNVTWLKRLIQKSSYEFVRVILNLSTFYFRHE
jgi:cardiolipin synthase A/B